MNSRHLTGHAVDLGPLLPDGQIPWDDWSMFEEARRPHEGRFCLVRLPDHLGGEWQMMDGPHFESTWDAYPLPEPEAPPNRK